MTDNELIAEFMGYESIRIGYYGTDDETEWQVKNKDWLDKPEIIEQYDNSVGDYYVNIDRNLIIPQEEVNYADSWDWLMPVVEKIESSGFNVLIEDNFCRIGQELQVKATTMTKIESVYKAVVEFIKWYNQNK